MGGVRGRMEGEVSQKEGGFIPRPCSPSARIVNPLLCNTLLLAQGNRNISTRCATMKV